MLLLLGLILFRLIQRLLLLLLLLLLLDLLLLHIQNHHRLNLLLLLLLDRKNDPCREQSFGLLSLPSNHRDVRRVVKLGFG